MKKNRCRRGIIMLVIGIMLLLLAGGWYTANILEDRAAGEYTVRILDNMDVSEELDIVVEGDDKPAVIVDEEAFCGRIVIEKLGMELPVFQEWNYKKLKKAPCRYSGSVETQDMIVAAHNYKSHFGKINTLDNGDELVFIDASGETYYFEVKEILILDGSAVEDMSAGAWDFTLFTCTKGGKQRVVVRCESVSDEK